MIKNIFDMFHRHRAAGDHKKAMEVIKPLSSRYSFTETQIVTALVTDDFLEDDCLAYLQKHGEANEG